MREGSELSQMIFELDATRLKELIRYATQTICTATTRRCLVIDVIDNYDEAGLVYTHGFDARHLY